MNAVRDNLSNYEPLLRQEEDATGAAVVVYAVCAFVAVVLLVGGAVWSW